MFLNISKYLFCILLWQFDLEGRASLTPNTILPPVRLTSGNNLSATVPITQYDCSEAHRHLGDLMAC